MKLEIVALGLFIALFVPHATNLLLVLIIILLLNMNSLPESIFASQLHQAQQAQQAQHVHQAQQVQQAKPQSLTRILNQTVYDPPINPRIGVSQAWNLGQSGLQFAVQPQDFGNSGRGIQLSHLLTKKQ